MSKFIYIFICAILLSMHAFTQDSIASYESQLKFKGQFSSWGHYDIENSGFLNIGSRYIPQLNYEKRMPQSKLLDFEVSANTYGNVRIHFFDSIETNGDINPYRLWGRYSSKQFEFRVGLQKIDFGTATILRTLRWFDQVDPRDPLRLTEGVWAGLFRYYFLNNANVWVWGLYGNKNLKGTEVLKSSEKIPEFGGRFQTLIPRGEAGISYHHRSVNPDGLIGLMYGNEEISENRIGLDAKWDLVIGLWFEAAWINKGQDIGQLTNQEVFTFGTDYTFGIGSGLNVVLEHMLIASDEKAFQLNTKSNFTGLSIAYPIGMFDNVSTIMYYDWDNNARFNFINWFRQFDRITLYVIGYWNPDSIQMQSSVGAQNLYGGKGVQVMFVYNH